MEDQSGRPVSVNIDTIHDMIQSDREIGLKQISELLNISYECVLSYSSRPFGHEQNLCKVDVQMSEY